jgi:hypothetical protein
LLKQGTSTLTDLINKNKKTGDTTKTVVPATKEEAKAAIQTKAKEEVKQKLRNY